MGDWWQSGEWKEGAQSEIERKRERKIKKKKKKIVTDIHLTQAVE